MNIDQVENAWLAGSTDFEEAIAKIESEFFAPMELRLMKMAWATMTDQEKELVRKIAPDAFAVVEEQMKEV